MSKEYELTFRIDVSEKVAKNNLEDPERIRDIELRIGDALTRIIGTGIPVYALTVKFVQDRPD